MWAWQEDFHLDPAHKVDGRTGFVRWLLPAIPGRQGALRFGQAVGRRREKYKLMGWNEHERL